MSGDGSTLYFDSQGSIWYLDVETAQPTSIYEALPRYHESTDCSGTAYVTAIHPRYAFRIDGESTYRVRKDTETSAMRRIRSSRTSAGCNTMDNSLRVIPLDNTLPPTAITRPMTSFVPPLHLEQL